MRTPESRPDPNDDGPHLPHGHLFGEVFDADGEGKRQALLEEIQAADIVVGRNRKTGEETLYYGIAQAKRIVRRGTAEDASVVAVGVDPATDDVEVLCALVIAAKGACCYTAFSEPDAQ